MTARLEIYPAYIIIIIINLAETKQNKTKNWNFKL